MSNDAGWPLQAAIYAQLAASDLMNSISGIYDHVPEGAAFPYITVGEAMSQDWSSNSFSGQEHRLTLHAWSREAGRKQVKELLGQIHAVLHEQSVIVTGHKLVSLRYEFSETFKDPDGLTHQGVIRFRAVTVPLT